MNRVEPNRNIYVGHRYVPLLVGEWDKSIQYEGLSIVTFKGASYTSKKRTPAGIDIENEEYWVLTGNYNAQIEYYRDEVNTISSDIQSLQKEYDEKVMVYTDVQRTLYVDGNADITNETGERTEPFKTMSKAFNHIKKLSNISAQGKWIIRVSGIIRESNRVLELPLLREGLDIVGDTTISGNPDTRFEGDGYGYGLWFEPADGLNINVSNIIFKDFNNYGVLMKDKGRLNISNSHFINISRGVGSVNQNRTTVFNSYFEGCFSGITSEYGSTLTAGSNDKNGNEFYNCVYGVTVQRNSVAHVDYNEFTENTNSGININESSRVNVTGNRFDSNRRAVTSMGGSEWIENDNEFINSTDYDFQHFGTGKETRQYGQRSNINYQMPIYEIPDSEIIGDAEMLEDELKQVVTLPSIYRFPKGFFKGEGQKVIVKLHGRVLANPNNSSAFLSVDTVTTTGGNQANLGSATVNNTSGAFILEVENTTLSGKNQLSINKLFQHRGDTVVLSSFKNSPTNVERRIRINARLRDPEMVIEITHCEYIQAG